MENSEPESAPHADASDPLKSQLQNFAWPVWLAFIGYLGLSSYGFVNWDDPLHVYANPYVATLSLHNLQRLWSSPYEGLYIPVTYTVLALLGHVGQLASPATTPTNTLSVIAPGTFHVASVILHFINVVLVAGLIARLGARLQVAYVGAAIFAIHPVQVESVAWISEIRGLLGGFFGLLALQAYVVWRQSGSRANSQRNWRPYVLATLCFVLSLLSKPSYASIPLIALVLDRLALGRTWRQSMLPIGIWVVAVTVCIGLTRSAQPLLPDQITPLWQRPFVAGDSIAFYLGKLVWPLHLTIDYGRTSKFVMGHWWGYFTWLLSAAVAGIAFVFGKSRPLVWAGVLLFMAALLPVSGIVPFGFQSYSTVADRYLYFPMVGIALAVSSSFENVRRPAIFAITGVIAVCFLLTVAEKGVWRDSLSLFSHAVAERPDSSLMRLNLGATLVNLGRDGEGLKQFEEALRLDPKNAIAQSNVGLLLMKRGDIAGATDAFHKAVADQPGYGVPHCDLGQALVMQGKDVEALAEFQKAAAVEPDMVDAHQGMADILARHGQPANAIKELTIVAQLSPSNAVARFQLGRSLDKAGRPCDALPEYRAALALAPGANDAVAAVGKIEATGRCR